MSVSAVLDAYPRVEDAETLMPVKVAPPVKVGDSEKTRFPVPVSSVTSVASSDEVSILVDDTLLLKDTQSPAVIHPCVEPFAVSQFRVLLDQVRPVPAVYRSERVVEPYRYDETSELV